MKKKNIPSTMSKVLREFVYKVFDLNKNSSRKFVYGHRNIKKKAHALYQNRSESKAVKIHFLSCIFLYTQTCNDGRVASVWRFHINIADNNIILRKHRALAE